MKPSDYFKIGPRLTLAFVLLISLILAGNALVIWQFNAARIHTDRLISANQQLIAALELQAGLLLFHQHVDDLARSGDALQLTNESVSLRRAFREQVQQARSAATREPHGIDTDPALLPTLDTIEVALPSQLGAISDLAKSGDWESVQQRLDNELKPIETQTAVLVNRIQQQADSERREASLEVETAHRRILLIVPITAMTTFFIVAVFGWAIARRIVELRLEERVGERTRIARELHDSLLQSLHGLMFEFQAARNMFRKRPDDALHALDGAIMGTEQAIIESQDAIAELRSNAAVDGDLARLIELAGENLAAVRGEGQDSPSFGLTVEGRQRVLTPGIRDEIYRIAREVLRNAFRHAQARRVEAEILYDDDQLRLRVRDDGKGIDPKVIEEGRRPGHWGLPGVRERAQQIGAKLDVWSEAGAGTEVQLRVTASIAYGKTSSHTKSRTFHEAGKDERRS